MELRNRIRKVKKALPNLGGRANQLPPIGTNAFASSKRSFSTTNQINAHGGSASGQGNGRKSNPSQMFASGGMNDLNQSSAGAIPINSMYAGDAEREAAIPPPMEGMEPMDENEEEQENEMGEYEEGEESASASK